MPGKTSKKKAGSGETKIDRSKTIGTQKQASPTGHLSLPGCSYRGISGRA